jgi:long-chain acyl-CoA synthetase
MVFEFPFEILEGRAQKWGNKNFIGVLRLGDEKFEDFKFLTWAQCFERLNAYGLYLQKLGLERGDRIALQGRNSAEWLFLDWAAVSCGLITVPLYAQSHPDEVKHILSESEARVLFCDEKDERISPDQILISHVDSESQKMSGRFVPTPLEADAVSSIIYTSGTSGVPKGVMHSYRAFFEAVKTANQVLRLSPKDRLLSYLPLSHVAERVLIAYGALFSGAKVYICDRVDKTIAVLPKVRPTVFFAVPRVWDTIRARIEKELKSTALIQERLSKIPWFLRSWLLGRFIQKKIGLDRARLCISGAAKLFLETMKAFQVWGIKVHEAFGLTETLCISAINIPGKPIWGSVGKVYKDVECKIASDGEICLRAAFHFKGYYKHPELDAEVLKDGWFHSGDIGKFDDQGNLIITDRKKNIFKASNGKYVAPLAIESLLRQHPALGEVVVFGENKPHCIAVACLNSEVDEASIVRHLETVNSKLPSHEQVRSLGVFRKSWGTQSGEMTASMKVKRRAIMEMYDRQIKELYESSSRVRFF